jgi:hypothetical protein
MTSEGPLRVGGTAVPRESVVDAELRTGRDVRYLLAALAALLSAVLLPTLAVAVGVPFPSVFPVGALLFLLALVSLARWLRSSVTRLVVETSEGTHRERVPDDRAWAETVVEEFGGHGEK